MTVGVLADHSHRAAPGWWAWGGPLPSWPWCVNEITGVWEPAAGHHRNTPVGRERATKSLQGHTAPLAHDILLRERVHKLLVLHSVKSHPDTHNFQGRVGLRWPGQIQF